MYANNGMLLSMIAMFIFFKKNPVERIIHGDVND